jgi:GH24 family phage-related lysozyme (muramidase)
LEIQKLAKLFEPMLETGKMLVDRLLSSTKGQERYSTSDTGIKKDSPPTIIKKEEDEMGFPKDTTATLLAYYGNPDPDHDGKPNAAWESTNLIYVYPPWRIYHTAVSTTVPYVKGIRVHKKCADSLNAILNDIWNTFAKSQAEIEKVGMHLFSGAYYYRKIASTGRISCHAFGAAIDWDAQHNSMGHSGKMDSRVVACFQRHGWKWLGPTHDPMHFQATETTSVNTNLPAPVVLKPVVPPPSSPHAFKFDQRAVELIKRWEGFVPHAYQDATMLAIGYGHTSAIGPPIVMEGMLVDVEEATQILEADMQKVWSLIQSYIKVPLSAQQQGAIISFCYNIGTTNFLKSTLLKRINESDFAGASLEFAKWNKSLGKVLPGLVKRRESERQLFIS